MLLHEPCATIYPCTRNAIPALTMQNFTGIELQIQSMPQVCGKLLTRAQTCHTDCTKSRTKLLRTSITHGNASQWLRQCCNYVPYDCVPTAHANKHFEYLCRKLVFSNAMNQKCRNSDRAFESVSTASVQRSTCTPSTLKGQSQPVSLYTFLCASPTAVKHSCFYVYHTPSSHVHQAQTNRHTPSQNGLRYNSSTWMAFAKHLFFVSYKFTTLPNLDSEITVLSISHFEVYEQQNVRSQRPRPNKSFFSH